MSRVFVYKGKESKVIDVSEVVEHYENGWTDNPAKEAMSEEDIARALAKKTERTTPCPTCGHVEAALTPVETRVNEVATPIAGLDDEPAEEGEEPVSEATLSYAEYTKNELLEMIESEGQKPNKAAKKEDLIKTLIFIRGE